MQNYGTGLRPKLNRNLYFNITLILQLQLRRLPCHERREAEQTEQRSTTRSYIDEAPPRTHRLVLLRLLTVLCSWHREAKHPKRGGAIQIERDGQTVGLCSSPLFFADCSFPGGVRGGVEEAGPREISGPLGDTGEVEAWITQTEPDGVVHPQVQC